MTAEGFQGVAPRSFAASSSRRSKPIRRERTTTTTKLMQNMTWAISGVEPERGRAEDEEEGEERGAHHDLRGRHRDHDQEVRRPPPEELVTDQGERHHRAEHGRDQRRQQRQLIEVQRASFNSGIPKTFFQ